MRKVVIKNNTLIERNKTHEGKSIEQLLADKVEGEEVSIGGKTLLYTERKDGVLPLTDIRSDRMEIAMEALDSVERSRVAARDKPVTSKKDEKGEGTGKTEGSGGTGTENPGGSPSIHATE